MSKQDILLEIGLEEMPARFVTDAMYQLSDKIAGWFTENRVPFGEVIPYSTPRRLAVKVTEVSEQQEDKAEELRGPARKIALDENGNWSKAALGFARGQGVSPEDMYFKEVKNTEYVFANKHTSGVSTMEILPQLDQVIQNLHFPKNMRWSDQEFKFVRPIKWILFLFGSEVPHLEVAGVKSDRKTFGHRFLGEEIEIDSPEQYPTELLGQFVIADSNERKEAIQNQLHNLQEEEGWIIPIDDGLLEEVNNLVEYPTALHGKFDEEFLELPSEVLITSMREHQRYFPVQNKDGELQPYFVAVRNGDHNNLQNVAKGNEKVLRARLKDAQFFYNEDKKKSIDTYLERLKSIVFHEELGTIANKVSRISAHAERTSALLQLDQESKEAIRRAATISKFDLVTQMVYEFPELQGVMGEKYAKMFGEDDLIAAAINEHYQPRYSGDNLPGTVVGSVLSVSDKLDTIVGCFGIGIIPTGSQDPYALRRQAAGVLQILLQKGWPVTVEELLNAVLDEYERAGKLKNDRNKVLHQLIEFFNIRMKTILQDQAVRYDVIDAVLSGKIGRVDLLVKRAEILGNALQEESFKGMNESLTRILNISKNVSESSEEVQPELFENSEEKALYELYLDANEACQSIHQSHDVEMLYNKLKKLPPAIDQYFENTMVNAEEDHLRANRQTQMKQMANVIRAFADFNQLVI
ncbi:glycine--tRNA ligase subunit beta [Pseudalkalibacillus berkeleyi]|uniref:Glycine--tRNA ligase beta subunit n=1 Tax=Pseudalkalibacillus berkeleyi TaxID=1069813 RepID=A0ABS9GYW9_9BACL|nr:glycine--tRNA ligase subunit beta [Pseudalkalibacillus berkeleyi]MCF6137957.1 glycine--tRNA ligase subunit beta [Pseudalkalibacillus berkeleyi]